jgi:hypothetical protein
VVEEVESASPSGIVVATATAPVAAAAVVVVVVAAVGTAAAGTAEYLHQVIGHLIPTVKYPARAKAGQFEYTPVAVPSASSPSPYQTQVGN